MSTIERRNVEGGQLRGARPRGVVLLGLLASSCAGEQSTFSPFGIEAETTLLLTWAMSIGFALVAIGVVWLAVHAYRAPPEQLDLKSGMRLVLWLGGVGPTLLLGAMLILSLPSMRAMPLQAEDLRVEVSGEQFWWRVRYLPAGGVAVETANEIRVPVGRIVAFHLSSPDVIHSFWIPGLAGKLDMIPGRTNELIVRATRPGNFRGACTEFCGLSHANMAFDVVAMEPAEFDRWLAVLAQPAAAAQGSGAALFQSYGCNGCHMIRGQTQASSSIGPDLTHFGARRSLAAGTLPMNPEAIAGFIRDPSAAKPGVRMPAFPDMSGEDAAAIAAYLQGLR
jgi:cytochrome c oxidase subunit II